MNARTIEICYMLIDSTQEYSIESLANHFKVTPRMIRKDFIVINEFLNFKHAKIEIDLLGKVELTGNKQEVSYLVSTIGYYDYTLSQHERLLVMALLLIVSDDFVTLADCADFMSISRSTLVKDIEQVREFLGIHGLQLVSKSNHGMNLKAKESAIRDFILSMLINRLDEVKRFFSQTHILLQKRLSTSLELLFIQNIVHECENQTQTYFAPDSFSVLTYFIFLSQIRIEDSHVLTEIKVYEQTKFLELLVNQLNQVLKPKLIESEISNIGAMLKSVNYLARSHQSVSIIKTQMLTRRFIESVSKDLRIDLNSNYQFYENLSNHLASIINSGSERIQEFPEIKEWVKQKEWLGEVVKKNVSQIEQIAGYSLSEVEIDYIVIYVSVAIEQLKNQVSLRVLIVCNSGIATNQLIKERLKQQFGANSWMSMSSREYAEIHDFSKYDLIISTVYIESNNTEVILVSPMLTVSNLEEIRIKMDELRLLAITNESLDDEVVFEQMIDNSNEELRIKNHNLVNEFLDNASLENIPKLSSLLTEGYIELDVEVDTWQEAIVASAKPMLDSGDIEPRYIDAMIRQVEINGPYIVISKGVAVPHGSFNQGTNNVAMSLIKLKKPVNFGIEEYDPVEIVCALSPIDHNQHLRAFFTLVNLLLDPSYKEVLFKAQSKEQILRVIQEYERGK